LALVHSYEVFLEDLCKRLTDSVQADQPGTATEFERVIREQINNLGGFQGQLVNPEPKAQEFPDIPMPPFGIEVKFTENDTWRSIANSVSEGSRNEGVVDIYVVFGKMGGSPEVRWGKYEDVVMHVRTSHVPRFEIDMGATESLFRKFGITYAEFQKLAMHDKMTYIRSYARGRLREGERLWWLEDLSEEEKGNDSHTLPLEVKLYMHLTQDEKRKLRAEGALLSPSVVAGSRVKNKYNDVVMYILTRYGVLCPQARDLFSAGSVALRADAERGGIYIMRAMRDIEAEMRRAAAEMTDDLFVEYWGVACRPEDRIREWLRRADELADGWIPSEVLFQGSR
jgi:hypothetical protein